jgi:hypothetical protein
MKLHNYTGNHDINLYNIKDTTANNIGKLILNEGATPIAVLPPEGCVRAARDAKQLASIEIDGIELPVNKVQYGIPSGLPTSFDEEDYYIVSFIALCSIREHYPELAKHFLIIDGMVTGADGKPCGCTGFSIG